MTSNGANKKSVFKKKSKTKKVLVAIPEIMSALSDVYKKPKKASKKETKEKLNKPRRKISRRKPGQKIINYFDDDAQAAIVAYQNEDDTENKKKIYVEKILPAFDSLVENLINVYGFSVMHETKTDLKNECLEFLYGAVGKFNPERGSRAFSYFNVVAKNWLTIRSKQNAKKIQTYISLDNKDEITKEDMEFIETYKVIPSYEDIVAMIESRNQIFKIIDAIEEKARTENEKKCVAAIKDILEKIDEVDLLSKRAILVYLREQLDISSKAMSLTISNLRKYYKELKATEEFS